jgi:hypothetical protein
MISQSKVKSLFENLNAVEPHLKVQFFVATAGWFEYVKVYHSFRNLNVTDEAAVAHLVCC